MKRPSYQTEKTIEMIFGLAPANVALRKQWRMILFIVVWFVLSGLTMMLTFIGVDNNLARLILVGLSFIKYIPIIYVTYIIAKNVAAKYLQDIYELDDEGIAVTFLEKVAFGYDDENAIERGGKIWNSDGQSIIRVTDGEISEHDQETTILQIGGPGHAQVNLGNVVLFEKVDGTPEIFHARGMPWKIGRFDRIREVGGNEYAIINLSDQFLSGLSVNSRTKDGIPLGAHDIKIMFRVLRQQIANANNTDDAALLYDPEAVKALVYEQTIVRPKPLEEKSSFPWNTTILQLIENELEDLIRKHTLGEILASIGQKEIDQALVNQDSVAQIRNELTRQQKVIPRDNKPATAPKFTSRSMITSQFYSPEFKEKAARIGVSLEWIDIGTWKHPPAPIFDKLKDAWKKAGDNASKKTAAERKKGKTANEEFIKLVNSAIIEKYEQPKNTANKKNSEKAKESETIYMNEYNNLMRRFGEVAPVEKTPNTIALDILKAIRKELLAGKELIDIEFKEVPTAEDKRALDNIEKVIRDINLLEMHWLK